MVGALLVQPCRKTEDPIKDPPESWYIIHVVQKQLNKYQKNWAVIVKELYGVVVGIGECRETMMVCRQRWVLNDHKPLSDLARTLLWGKLTPVQQRLMTVLLSLNARWFYCPGEKSQIQDVTSRWRLIHAPEGSQLIPVPMRNGEVLGPAPLMSRIVETKPLHQRVEMIDTGATVFSFALGENVGSVRHERLCPTTCWTSWAGQCCRSMRS